MIGVYDFCGHYDWTFAWLLRCEGGGPALLREYWEEAISRDSQRHARDLIAAGGFDGMARYWGHTLREQAAGYPATAGADPGTGRRFFRLDMYDCPSRGFLLRNGLEFSPDYCDHCIGWIGPVLADAGFGVDHEHDHGGCCWWEIREADDPAAQSAPGETAGADDARLLPDWDAASRHHFARERRAAQQQRKEERQA